MKICKKRLGGLSGVQKRRGQIGSVSQNQQLDEIASGFINDPSRNHLEGNTLYVSKIFDWFEEDFNGDVVGFILKYAKGGLKGE